MTRFINYPTSVGIQDLCCTGINPLRCVVCQERKKEVGKKTCGDKQCVHIFFERCVVPDVDETRTISSRVTKDTPINIESESILNPSKTKTGDVC